MIPPLRARAEALLARFYDDEGEGLGGARLFRCRVCQKGSQEGGSWPTGRQHHARCPVADLLTLHAEADQEIARLQRIGEGCGREADRWAAECQCTDRWIDPRCMPTVIGGPMRHPTLPPKPHERKFPR